MGLMQKAISFVMIALCFISLSTRQSWAAADGIDTAVNQDTLRFSIEGTQIMQLNSGGLTINQNWSPAQALTISSNNIWKSQTAGDSTLYLQYNVSNGAVTIGGSGTNNNLNVPNGKVTVGTWNSDSVMTVAPFSQGIPSGWGGYGIHTGDIYINGTAGFGNNGNIKTSIDNAGNAQFSGALQTGTITSSAYYYSSDERLKEDIETFRNPLDVLSNLRGVTYKWKKDHRPSAGVIAQEVEKIIPAAVSTNAEGMKTVEYSELFAPMIESIKVLKDQNAALLKRIEALEAAHSQPSR